MKNPEYRKTTQTDSGGSHPIEFCLLPHGYEIPHVHRLQTNLRCKKPSTAFDALECLKRPQGSFKVPFFLGSAAQARKGAKSQKGGGRGFFL